MALAHGSQEAYRIFQRRRTSRPSQQTPQQFTATLERLSRMFPGRVKTH